MNVYEVKYSSGTQERKIHVLAKTFTRVNDHVTDCGWEIISITKLAHVDVVLE
jgi:hypothetical protein